MIAKFDSLEHRLCEDIKGIVAPEIDLKRLGSFRETDPRSCPLKHKRTLELSQTAFLFKYRLREVLLL